MTSVEQLTLRLYTGNGQSQETEQSHKEGWLCTGDRSGAPPGGRGEKDAAQTADHHGQTFHPLHDLLTHFHFHFSSRILQLSSLSSSLL